jgi:hypothetical protein
MIFNHSANIKLHTGTVTGAGTRTPPQQTGDNPPVTATGSPLRQCMRYLSYHPTALWEKSYYIVPRSRMRMHGVCPAILIIAASRQ